MRAVVCSTKRLIIDLYQNGSRRGGSGTEEAEYLPHTKKDLPHTKADLPQKKCINKTKENRTKLNKTKFSPAAERKKTAVTSECRGSHSDYASDRSLTNCSSVQPVAETETYFTLSVIA